MKAIEKDQKLLLAKIIGRGTHALLTEVVPIYKRFRTLKGKFWWYVVMECLYTTKVDNTVATAQADPIVVIMSKIRFDMGY